MQVVQKNPLTKLTIAISISINQSIHQPDMCI